MQNFLRFLDRISSGRTLILALLIYSVFPAYFLKNAEEKINQLSGKKVEIIDLGFRFDTDRTTKLLNSYTLKAKQYYAQVESSVDVAYPIVYAFTFSIILVLVFRKNRFKTPQWVPILPFIALIFDYIENFFIVRLLNDSTINQQNLIFCETAKTAKWLLLLLIIGFFFYGIFNLLYHKFFTK